MDIIVERHFYLDERIENLVSVSKGEPVLIAKILKEMDSAMTTV